MKRDITLSIAGERGKKKMRARQFIQVAAAAPQVPDTRKMFNKWSSRLLGTFCWTDLPPLLWATKRTIEQTRRGGHVTNNFQVRSGTEKNNILGGRIIYQRWRRCDVSKQTVASETLVERFFFFKERKGCVQVWPYILQGCTGTYLHVSLQANIKLLIASANVMWQTWVQEIKK